MKRLFSWIAHGCLLLLFFVAVAPAWAADVDKRIQALEDELIRLKSEQTQVKAEQIEMRKEARAAEAALPTFSYRPGGGLTVTAADQAWALNFGYEFAYDMMFLDGDAHRREGKGSLFGRRNRPHVGYFWDNGFYEFVSELDMDSDETGGKDSLNQRSAMFIHFEQLNPFLPTFQFGMDQPGAGSKYRSSELTLELPTLDRNNGFNTGSNTGMAVRWEDLPAFGLPGNQQFHYYWVIHGMGRSDGLKDQSNKTDHLIFYNISPFAKSENKWINGIGVSMMAWLGNIDDRNATNSTRTFQLRTQEGSTRVPLWSSPTRGSGRHAFIAPSAQYKVGPYQIRGVGGFDKYSTDNRDSVCSTDSSVPDVTPSCKQGGASAAYWKVMNDIMLWSPKGFFTGSATTPNTLGLGFSFEKTWVDCGNRANPACQAGGKTGRRDSLIVREVDLRYWFRPSLMLTFAMKWHDNSNTPTSSQVSLGCSSVATAPLGKGASKNCQWMDSVLRFYWVF